MCSADCRAYARNKRGIAGNLIWINFDRDSLLALVESAGGKFVADIDEIRPSFVGNDQIDPSSQAIFATSLTRSAGPSVGSTIDAFNQIGQTGVNDFAAVSTPWYHDQILPFDITLSGVNEQGSSAAMKIFGVEILNSGGGNSIDDAVNEQTATFVARSIELKPGKSLSIRRLPPFSSTAVRVLVNHATGASLLAGTALGALAQTLLPASYSQQVLILAIAGFRGAERGGRRASRVRKGCRTPCDRVRKRNGIPRLERDSLRGD